MCDSATVLASQRLSVLFSQDVSRETSQRRVKQIAKRGRIRARQVTSEEEGSAVLHQGNRRRSSERERERTGDNERAAAQPGTAT